jgi:hypothetical protein
VFENVKKNLTEKDELEQTKAAKDEYYNSTDPDVFTYKKWKKNCKSTAKKMTTW